MAINFLKVRNGITLKPQSAPATAENGDIYYDSSYNTFYLYKNGSWVALPTGGGTNSPVWSSYNLTYSSFSTASTSNTITLVTIPPKTMIHQVVIKHSTAFSGSGITGYTVSIGDAAKNVRFTQPWDVTQTVSDTTRSITQVDDIESFASSTNILITANSTGTNLSAATAGAVEVWLLTSVLN